jgi:hypothetical protein
MQDVFRRHFESSFAPLPARKTDQPDVSMEDANENISDNEEDEWSGCSSNGVEVIEHADPIAMAAEAHDTRELRAFMVRCYYS